MKLNIKLGVPTADLLKSPTACFRLSKAATRISDALSFSEFYVQQAEAARAPFFNKRDIEHISAGFWQSSKSAADLSVLVDDQELRKEIQIYAKAASRINNMIRGALKTKKDEKSKEKAKPITFPVSQVVNKAKDLRKKALAIEEKVEDLCTVRSKIEMIERHRARTGAGLKEAKDAVERLKDYGPVPEASMPNVPASAGASPSISGRGRVMMAGSGGIIHKKKPMYPRYFVASMGRSRR